MADDFADGVKAGVSGAATGSAIAGAGAAIGAAAGASLGPFAVIAAPIGAAVGALIGFFVWLGSSTSKKDAAERIKNLTAAQEAHAVAIAKAAETGPGLAAAIKSFGYEMKYLNTVASSIGKTDSKGKKLSEASAVAGMKFNVEQFIQKSDSIKTLQTIATNHPEYSGMVNELIAGLRLMATDWKNRAAHMAALQKVIDFVTAIGALPGNLADDPMAYLRPPLASTFGPALAAAGINISDPAVLQIIRGNFDLGTAVAAVPRQTIGLIPIARRSLGANSGGKIAIDQRAFSPKIAPYGVVSYAIAPNTATQAWYTKEPYASSHGVPLTALWPYGLDADRFALPPRPILGAIAGLPTVVKVGAPAAAVAALLFFL